MVQKKAANKLFIEVLQNGFSVCSQALSLSRRAIVTLGTDSKATLTLPHYPLPARVELFQLSKHGVHLEIRSSWEGFVTSDGEIVDLASNKGNTISMRAGDYGTIYYGDLQILVRIGKPWAQKVQRGQRRFKPELLSLAFYSTLEMKVMAGATFVAAMIFMAMTFLATNTSITRPSTLADLAPRYIESVMYPDHFETLPEALQSKLNRTNYAKSAIGYYRTISELLTGRPLTSPELIFESSELYFGQLHNLRRDTISNLELHQANYESSFLSKPETAMIDLPAVRGESVRQAVLRLFDKIDLQHDSFRAQLSKRRATIGIWEEIPEFNVEDYRGKKSSARKEAEDKLSQISPFNMESDEANMYRIAKDWSDRVGFRRKRIRLQSAEKPSLLSADHSEVAIPDAMNFASFLQKAAVIANEDKLASMQATVYGAPPTEKVKEPLVGEIDPRLVQKAVEEHWHGLRLCYELALRRDNQIAGEVEWRWRIDSRGDISDIELVNSTIGDNRMLNCIKNKMATWQFPPPRRGSVQVRYPFRFSKTKG